MQKLLKDTHNYDDSFLNIGMVSKDEPVFTNSKNVLRNNFVK